MLKVRYFSVFLFQNKYVYVSYYKKLKFVVISKWDKFQALKKKIYGKKIYFFLSSLLIQERKRNNVFQIQNRIIANEKKQRKIKNKRRRKRVDNELSHFKLEDFEKRHIQKNSCRYTNLNDTTSLICGTC